MKKKSALQLAKKRDAELKLKARAIAQAKKDAFAHKEAINKLNAQKAKIGALIKAKML